MSDTPAQIRNLYDTDPDRDAYDAIAQAVQSALTARDELIAMLTARALETGGQVAAVREFADRRRGIPADAYIVRALDAIVGTAPGPALTDAGLPRREPRPPFDPRTAK